MHRLLSHVWSSTRWRIRLRRVRLGLRNVVRLLWLAGRRRRVVLGDESLDGATTLDAVDDEKDPGDELADTANHETGDCPVELAFVAIRAGVVVGVIVVVAVGVAAPAARGVGQVCTGQSTADDKQHHSSNEEANRPPFGQP